LNQKVNLLLDTKYFDKADIPVKLTFMEIRNQFMHIDRAKSFTNCLRFIEGKKTFLIKKYPNDKATEGEILEQYWTDSTADVIKSIEKVIEVMKNKDPKKLGDNIVIYFKQVFDKNNN